MGFSRGSLASCHNIPAVAGGSNTDKRNLSPCLQIGVNINGAYNSESMRTFESWAMDQVAPGGPRVLDYHIDDQYNYADSGTIPSGYWYVATSMLPNGSDSITKTLYVPNAGYIRDGACVNIGMDNVVESIDCG
jgi:hypothetical protein